MSDQRTLTQRLTEARAKLPSLARDGEGQVGPRRYKYTTLTALLEAVVPTLSEHGLTVLQPLEARDDGGLLVVTEVRGGGDGEALRAEVPVPPQSNPQQLGSWITYARRYGLAALLAVASEDDDDGAGAAPKASKPTGPRPVPPPQQQDQAETRETITGVVVTGVKTVREGTKRDGTPYTMWALELQDRDSLTTFSSTVAEKAENFIGAAVELEVVHRGKYTNVVSLADAEVPF